MFARSKLLSTVLVVAAGSVAVAAYQGFATSFISAPAGVAVPSTAITLPPVLWQPGQPLPPVLAQTNGFTPGLDTLLSGEVVITNERQMRHVWRAVFGTAYDATQFNFHNSFVIWMGGGVLDFGGFSISAVEGVDANYAGVFPTTSTDVDPFLAVTATRFIPGNPPVGQPSFYAVSAVRVPREYFDDIVFHRTIFGAP